MFAIVIIPLWFVISVWRDQYLVCRNARRLCADLVLWKHELRSVGSDVLLPDSALGNVLRAGIGRGFRCVDALTDGIQALRGLLVRAEKVNRLRLLWTGRLAVVVLIAALVRCHLLGTVPALMVNGRTDGILVLTGAVVLFAGSALFFKTVPSLLTDQDGVAGFKDWLWNRILADNGCPEASMPDIVLLEKEECEKGISMREEKLEVLAAFWRTRISNGEAKAEVATELLPVFEFLGFGLFLVFALLPAFTQRL